MPVFILGVVALVIIACGGDKATAPAEDSPSPLAPGPGLVHIHGHGENPADGSLYVATHTGLYRLNAGLPEFVGGRNWDVMGFTVRGPNDFIGGGHPSLPEIREGKYRPLLGFIESKDPGQSWEILSLRGTADLHAFAQGWRDHLRARQYQRNAACRPEWKNLGEAFRTRGPQYRHDRRRQLARNYRQRRRAIDRWPRLDSAA